MALYVLGKIEEQDGLSINQLDELLVNGLGWSRVLRLIQAGVVEIGGDWVDFTDEGIGVYREAVENMGQEETAR